MIREGDYVRMPVQGGAWYGYVQEVRGDVAEVKPARGNPWKVHVGRLHVASDPRKAEYRASESV